METETATDVKWTAPETAEFFRQKMNLPLLKDMLTTFFRAKASEKGNKLLRRPPIAVRLLDGDDHVYTIRPRWNEPYRSPFSDQQEYGSFEYDKLYVDAIHQRGGRCAKFFFDDSKLTLTSWYTSRYFGALENFAQTSKEFVLFPWQVFSRSKDRCCICGKRLTDEISRGRGIGPECIRHVSHCFGQPLK